MGLFIVGGGSAQAEIVLQGKITIQYKECVDFQQLSY